ncbi:MAG TPA: NUDIX domain-containing protein [Streptosporangiales bacterium]
MVSAWRLALVPGHLPVARVHGLLLDPAGRCLIQVHADRTTSLPGGVPEPRDGDLFSTLRREAWEENQVVVTDVVHLGHQRVEHPGREPYAQVGLVGRICRFEPRRPDIDGRTYHRYLAPLADVAALLGWGGTLTVQAAAAARVATRLWHLPVDAPTRPAAFV